MYRTPVSDLDEREKYVRMWTFDAYRELSPGERAVPEFLKIVKPDGLIVDFGCGTGRASVALSKSGHNVFLVDFADNCREQEALDLPFLEWDLCKAGMPVTAEYGLCADVMEHIPTEDVEAVICNIMQSAKQVFFQISTVADCFGKFIGTPLHLTVRPHEWWLSFFQDLGFTVRWAEDLGNASRFVVIRDY
jgi:SAM-dependent methyltransferase